MIYKISTVTPFFRVTGGLFKRWSKFQIPRRTLKKKLVFITKGISIIFVRLILKNLRKCNHKTDTVYLEFEQNRLVFEVNLMPITVKTLEFCCKEKWVLMYARMQ